MRQTNSHRQFPTEALAHVLAGIAVALLCALPARHCTANATAASPGGAPDGKSVEISDVRVEIADVRVGIAGMYKLGHWTPIRVTVVAGEQPFSGEVVLTAPDGDGIPVDFVSALQIPAGGTSDSWHYVQFGRYESGLTTQLRRDGHSVARYEITPAQLSQTAKALSSTQRWYVTLGQPIGIEQAVALPRNSASREAAAHCITQNAAELPDRWLGYAGVDVVAISTSKPGALEALTPQQFAAIELWVRLGGKLVLCCGKRGNEVLADGSRILSLVPGRFDDVLPLERTAGLENYAGSTQRLDVVAPRSDEGGGDTTRMEELPMVTRLIGVRGNVEAYEGSGPSDLPTIVRAPLGLGEVVFVAVDLDLPPLANWQGRTRLVSKVLRETTRRGSGDERSDTLGRVMQLGFDDIVGQLRTALDQFPHVKQIPFLVVAGLTLVYLTAIGPLDYLLLRKVLRGRMHWTWLTFPLLVVLFCTLAVFLVAGSRGSRILVNQVEIIDIDLTDDAAPLADSTQPERQRFPTLARVTVWSNLYNPRTATYDVSLEHPLLDAHGGPGEMVLTWQGFPSDSLGGMYSKADSLLPDSSYTVHTDGRDARVADLPVQVASTKALMARGWVETDLSAAGELRVGSQNDLLEGDLVNPLPVELSNCVLYFRNWAYLIEGTLAPGQRVVFDRRRMPRTRHWQLTQSRVLESKDVAQPWDPADNDIPRIVEMMMFHDAAGGRTYTNLSHRYQPFVDLSEQIDLGRAVLVGQAASREAELMRDGQSLDESYERHWTFYRLVLDVEQAPPS
jgi:hypothetical protein